MLDALFEGVVVGDAGGGFVKLGTGAVGGAGDRGLTFSPMHHFGVEVTDGQCSSILESHLRAGNSQPNTCPMSGDVHTSPPHTSRSDV
jgi:hypothetical protein